MYNLIYSHNNPIKFKITKQKKRVRNQNHFKKFLENTSLGFPGGAVVENLPANAGDTGSSPGLGKIPHAAERLGL